MEERTKRRGAQRSLSRSSTGLERACLIAAWFFALLFVAQLLTLAVGIAESHAPADALWRAALTELQSAAWLLLGWIGAVRIGWSDPRTS